MKNAAHDLHILNRAAQRLGVTTRDLIFCEHCNEYRIKPKKPAGKGWKCLPCRKAEIAKSKETP